MLYYCERYFEKLNEAFYKLNFYNRWVKKIKLKLKNNLKILFKKKTNLINEKIS